MLIPFAILATIATLFLLFALIGRRIDDHPVCRRCKFDLIGLEPTICPECGSKLDEPKSIRTGNRRRYRRVAIFSIFLILAGLAGSGISIYGNAKKIDWYTYKPVWWLRLDAKHGGQETVTRATNELLARHDNNKLSRSDLDSIVTTLTSALEGAHVSTPVIYAHTLSELLTGGQLSSDAKDRLITWLLKLQTDPTKPWSTELGNAFLAECLAKRIPQELMFKFLEQTCAPRIQPLLKRPLRPGESTPVILTLNPRGGNSIVRFNYLGQTPLPPLIGREWTTAPSPGISVIGTLTAPAEPGSYTLEVGIKAGLRAEDMATNTRFMRGTQTPATPETTVDWKLETAYKVADSTPQDPLRDFAQRMFHAGSVQAVQDRRSPRGECPIYIVPPTNPMSVEFEVLWRSQGTETNIGSGSLSISRNGFSSSYRTANARSSNSAMGTSMGPRARPERYMMAIPNLTATASTGTIVIHITKLTSNDLPADSFKEFDLEFPSTQVHW